MKHLLIAFLCLPFFLFAQEGEEEKAPSLYEVINIKVKKGQSDAFEAAVKAHNEKFHGSDGMYNAFLTYNVNGPSAGWYTWIMGPTNWTAMDDRPGEGGHDDDWKIVDEHVEAYDGPGHWNLSAGLSHIAREEPYKKRLIWLYDLKQGKGARWAELVGKVKEVYEEKLQDESYWVVWNQFADSKAGADVAIIWGFDKYAWMDDDTDFGDLYEEVHGDGSWMTFLNEFMETIEGRVDWLRTVVE